MIDFGRIFGEQRIIFGVFFKSFAVIGAAMYLIYAIILIRQTGVMLRAVEEGHPTVIRAISYLQLIIAVVMIILALTIL